MPEGSVQSINRAFGVLEQLSTAKDGLSLTDIAERTGLSKSTAHRIVGSLAAGGYVLREEGTGRYTLGLKLIEIVSYYINSLELQTEARPYLWQLTSELNLTAHLGILEGSDVRYIEKLDLLPGLRLYSQIGLRVPASCSSLGKCLLSGLSGGQLSDVLGPGPFPRYTDRTITDAAKLTEELHRVRARGYAVDDGEFEEDHRCIGAPIYDYRGDVIAAVSASGTWAAIPLRRVPEVAARVQGTADSISRRLGYTG